MKTSRIVGMGIGAQSLYCAKAAREEFSRQPLQPAGGGKAAQ
jgi:hypothetical protein